MPAPDWAQKMLCVIVPIGEQFLLSSFRELAHDGYCLALLARFVHQQVRSPNLCVKGLQGKLLFSTHTFLTRNEGTTDELKKRLGCHQQEQFNLPREYSVFDGSQ